MPRTDFREEATEAESQMVESIGRHPLLGPLRQVEAGLLSVGYAQAGPGEGRVAVLLHGWPYDPHRYLQVAPLLAAAGDRVLVPSLRGLWDHPLPVRCPVPQRPAGRARGRPHRAAGRPGDRAGGPGRLRLGARTAAICAALWPQRCAGLVSVSGYLIGSQQAGRRPLPPEAERRWWSQDYFATERGRVGYGTYRREFAELIWRTASPRWAFDQASFDRTAQSFDNPDHVEVVIHNYRWRLGLADGEQEAPEAFAKAVIDVDAR
jgi:pimeloyl-ACP methyl ester carboxylesterase